MEVKMIMGPLHKEVRANSYQFLLKRYKEHVSRSLNNESVDLTHDQDEVNHCNCSDSFRSDTQFGYK
ncbi:hypothetical protein BCE02nite_32420 [Brevibacillus centrosporus]|nr:hypothetical protein BCE02nite_32420 [Brevibacillus centrosporus]